MSQMKDWKPRADVLAALTEIWKEENKNPIILAVLTWICFIISGLNLFLGVS